EDADAALPGPFDQAPLAFGAFRAEFGVARRADGDRADPALQAVLKRAFHGPGRNEQVGRIHLFGEVARGGVAGMRADAVVLGVGRVDPSGVAGPLEVSQAAASVAGFVG